MIARRRREREPSWPRASTPCTRGSSARWPTTTRGCMSIVASLRPLTGRRVLDLGCGKGRFARRPAGSRAPGWSGSTSPRRCSPAANGAGLDRVLRLGAPAPVRIVELRRRDRRRGLRAPRARCDRRRLSRGAARAPAGRLVRARGQERAMR